MMTFIVATNGALPVDRPNTDRLECRTLVPKIKTNSKIKVYLKDKKDLKNDNYFSNAYVTLLAQGLC